VDIHWYGHSCFRLRSGQGVVVTDPFQNREGVKLPRLRADVVTISHPHPGHGNASLVGDSPMVIDGPGEYEVKGIFVVGVATAHDAQQGAQLGPNTAYCITLDEITVCHLGDLGHPPSQAQIEELGSVDVLLVPVGGHTTIGAVQAADVTRMIDPAIVVPMHYASESRPDLDTVDKFLKEMGATGHPAEEMLRVAPGRLPDEPQVVVLEVRS
jgi:L-ascorbate metabolism protein UlaG (beta-lactamase superfamily)